MVISPRSKISSWLPGLGGWVPGEDHQGNEKEGKKKKKVKM